MARARGPSSHSLANGLLRIFLALLLVAALLLLPLTLPLIWLAYELARLHHPLPASADAFAMTRDEAEHLREEAAHLAHLEQRGANKTDVRAARAQVEQLAGLPRARWRAWAAGIEQLWGLRLGTVGCSIIFALLLVGSETRLAEGFSHVDSVVDLPRMLWRVAISLLSDLPGLGELAWLLAPALLAGGGYFAGSDGGRRRAAAIVPEPDLVDPDALDAAPVVADAAERAGARRERPYRHAGPLAAAITVLAVALLLVGASGPPRPPSKAPPPAPAAASPAAGSAATPARDETP